MAGFLPEDRLPPGRVLVVIAGIYLTQSAIGGLTFQGIPAVLRAAGARLDVIGLVSLLMLPWMLKALWAPAVERLRLPASGRRRSRLLIVGGQGFALLAFAALAGGNPAALDAGLFAVLALVVVVIATVDIACDGFAIDQLPPERRSWGNVMQVGGGYVGMMIGGGLFLVAVDHLGWSWAVLAITGALAVLTLPAALTPEPPAAVPAAQAEHRPSLAAAWRRPAVRWGLAMVVLTQLGLRLAQGMAGPFLIDQGVDLATLGVLSGGGGTAASLAAVLAAGAAVRRWGARRVLIAVLAAETALFAGLTLAALTGGAGLAVLGGLVLAKSAASAAIFVALYTAMMGWASPRQPGLDFTLFQCADAAIAAAAGLGGGVLAEHLGYAACFGLAAGFAAAAALLGSAVTARADG